MGAEGDTSIVQAIGACHRMSLISAVTERGYMRFMIIDNGSVIADVSIEFLKRLIKRRRPRNLLDRRSWLGSSREESLRFPANAGRNIRLFFLPPYSPDRGPDELVWKHLKADTVSRMAIPIREDFTKKVRGSMRDLQNGARKIISFFQKPSLKYAA